MKGIALGISRHTKLDEGACTGTGLGTGRVTDLQQVPCETLGGSGGALCWPTAPEMRRDVRHPPGGREHHDSPFSHQTA